MRIKLPVKILCQPDDTTCGPTSLHAVYDYYGMPHTLDDIIKSVNYLEDGGTLGVFLACDALKRPHQQELPKQMRQDRKPLLRSLPRRGKSYNALSGR